MGKKRINRGNKVTDSIGPQSSLFYFWFVCFFDVLTPSIAFFFQNYPVTLIGPRNPLGSCVDWSLVLQLVTIFGLRRKCFLRKL